MPSFYGALVQALQAAHQQGWKDRGQAESRQGIEQAFAPVSACFLVLFSALARASWVSRWGWLSTSLHPQQRAGPLILGKGTQINGRRFRS